MPTSNPIVSGLPAYVEQHIAPLLSKSILGAKSAKLMNLLTGVRGPSALNIMSNDVVLQDASSCGWNETGSTEFSQRTLTPAYLKVNMSFCDKLLLRTALQHEVKIAAGIKNLPVEEEWTKTCPDTEKPDSTTSFEFCKIRLCLETGRMHQSRIHLAAQGCPICGDDQHGNFKLNKQLKKCFKIKHLLLAAVKLTVPIDGKDTVFEIDPPDYFAGF